MDIAVKIVEQNMSSDAIRLQGSEVLCCSEVDSDTEDATRACCVCQKSQTKLRYDIYAEIGRHFFPSRRKPHTSKTFRNYYRLLLSFPSDDFTKQNIMVKKASE